MLLTVDFRKDGYRPAVRVERLIIVDEIDSEFALKVVMYRCRAFSSCRSTIEDDSLTIYEDTAFYAVTPFLKRL